MNKNKTDFIEILKNYNINDDILQFGNGHINDTYLLKNSGYILQRINTNVFFNPDFLMENILNVTTFLKSRIKANGGDIDRETLTVIKTTDGKNYYKTNNGDCFRIIKFIKNTKTIEKCLSPIDMYFAGKGFGHFQNMLIDFPANTLHETIKDFHNTKKRFEDLKLAINKDIKNRASICQKEIDFAMEYSSITDLIINEIEKGTIPIRVTHNDTKINNILFDEVSSEPICVIDLDTVMPGSLLYDFGDALRVGASNATEDETDLSKVTFNTDFFENFAKGYFEEMKDKLTKKEIELLPFSSVLLTYESGIRFLTDYLNGDTYFKTDYENHNLDRAKNQFKLTYDIVKKEEELSKIILNLYNN